MKKRVVLKIQISGRRTGTRSDRRKGQSELVEFSSPFIGKGKRIRGVIVREIPSDIVGNSGTG
jgi:hypothetical protein